VGEGTLEVDIVSIRPNLVSVCSAYILPAYWSWKTAFCHSWREGYFASGILAGAIPDEVVWTWGH